jgi:hypothetical protein
MARYFITFECNGEICHTTGDANFPTAEAFYSDNYSKKAADDIALAFVDGYLDVKNLLGEVKPRDIRYTIEFPSI